MMSDTYSTKLVGCPETHQLMPVVCFGSHVHPQLLHCSKSTLCTQVQWLPALGERWMLPFLLAGERGEQCRGFCSFAVAPPGVPLRVNDQVAKAFFAQFSEHVGDRPQHHVFIWVWKQTCWRSMSSMHSVLQAAVLEWWSRGQGNGVRKRDRLPAKMPPSCHQESIPFPLSKALQRLNWTERWSQSYLVIPGLSSAGLGGEVPTNCHCLSENEMDPLNISDILNPDTVRDDKAWG